MTAVRERAAALGGWVVIGPAASGGTEVRAWLPAARDDPSDRLMLVDDHPVFAQSLRELLAFPDNLDVVGVTDSAGKALIQIGPLAPDVVLMDLQMPGLDGVAATRRIAARHPATAVLALTMYDDDASVSAILRALEAGLAG